MLYIFHGENELLQAEAVAALLRRTLPPEAADFNTARFKGAVAFDEGHVGGAARQGFQAQRSASGENVRHAQGRQRSRQAIPRPEHVEQRLPGAIGDGPRRARPRPVDLTRPELSGDDPHGSIQQSPGIV